MEIQIGWTNELEKGRIIDYQFWNFWWAFLVNKAGGLMGFVRTRPKIEKNPFSCIINKIRVLTIDPQIGASPAPEGSLAPLRNLLLYEGGTLGTYWWRLSQNFHKIMNFLLNFDGFARTLSTVVSDSDFSMNSLDRIQN